MRSSIMRKRSRGLGSLALISAAGLALAACSSGSSGGGGSTADGKLPTYVIGAAIPLTGPAAAFGQTVEQGVQAAVDQVNKAGGIDGSKLKADFADNQATAQASVNAMNQLVSVDHANMIVMTTSAGVLATAPIATKDQVLMFNTGGSSPQLIGLSPYLFSNIPSASAEADVMLPYLRQKGYSKLVVFGSDDAIGSGISQYVQPLWQKLGGTYLGTQLENESDVDYSAVITKIKAMNPDVVYLATAAQQAGDFIKQAKQLGLKAQLVGYSALQTGGVLPVAGSSANGVLDSAYSVDLTSNVAKAYMAEFKALYPSADPSNLYTILGHDAVLIYVQAAKYLISHKMSYTAANLRTAILAIKSFEVAGGTTVFESNGSSRGAVTFSKIENGQFVPFDTVKPTGS